VARRQQHTAALNATSLFDATPRNGDRHSSTVQHDDQRLAGGHCERRWRVTHEVARLGALQHALWRRVGSEAGARMVAIRSARGGDVGMWCNRWWQVVGRRQQAAWWAVSAWQLRAVRVVESGRAWWQASSAAVASRACGGGQGGQRGGGDAAHGVSEAGTW